MRILTCVDPGDEYAHLIDVLVFPTDSQSARPHSDEMSGGDLDGDLYWCCWDPSLMPSRTVDAFDYSGPKAPIPRKSLSSETRERIDFFSQHDTDLLGTIDSLYFEFADRFKANCPECQELNHIFSNVVDYQPKYAKKTINQLRAKLRTIQERPRNFIWRRIEEENKKLRKEMSPNFGIVRIGHGDFMNNYGEKRNIEIFAADHDEPIFINNEEKYVGKFKHGDIVRFESKWSSFTNRYIASNVHLQNGMNINHLIKIMNVGICTGKIIQIFPSRDRDGDHSIERALGEISYKAYYLKQILSDSNESVPVSIVEFIG
ncbi:hypothetical protein MHBO_002638 [Bonamia ostreae]|uniref:RNA-dependent RNA polymerase n=1 Tax=Bonamia ostreae TaxID=126728 RepID=A0ABV2AMZ5_9EUKA